MRRWPRRSSSSLLSGRRKRPRPARREKTILSAHRRSGSHRTGAEAVTPLGRALAALERRDYATARQLFEALGRTDVVEAIGNALAALDRRDYATAESFFDALALPKPTRSAGGAIPSASGEKAQYKPAVSPPVVAPVAQGADRRAAPQAQKAKGRGLKRVLLRTGLVLLGIFCASAIYAPPWTFAAIKSQAIAGLASAVEVVKTPLEAITGHNEREEQRATIRDLGAALTQVTIRLDQIEHDYGARMDQLGERIDQNASLAARLDALEKKAGVPAAPASQLVDITTRLNKLEKTAAVPAAPGSEFADLTARLNRLEKRAAGSAASSATPLFRLSHRSNRRSWRERSLLPRTRSPGPTARGPCSAIFASRMSGVALRWLTGGMALRRSRQVIIFLGRVACCESRDVAAIGSS